MLFIVGCSDEKELKESNQNNVTILIKKEIEKLNLLETNTTVDKNISIKKEIIVEKKDLFLLNDINDNNHSIKFIDKNINISSIDNSLILLSFFSTWCQPCIGEIPYLIDIQNSYKKELFIAGIIVNDTINDSNLSQFIDNSNINYYVSNYKNNNKFIEKLIKNLNIKSKHIVPLLVLFKDGEYYTHYEGAVPIEMLEYDIKKAIKKGKE